MWSKPIILILILQTAKKCVKSEINTERPVFLTPSPRPRSRSYSHSRSRSYFSSRWHYYSRSFSYSYARLCFHPCPCHALSCGLHFFLLSHLVPLSLLLLSPLLLLFLFYTCYYPCSCVPKFALAFVTALALAHVSLLLSLLLLLQHSRSLMFRSHFRSCVPPALAVAIYFSFAATIALAVTPNQVSALASALALALASSLALFFASALARALASFLALFFAQAPAFFHFSAHALASSLALSLCLPFDPALAFTSTPALCSSVCYCLCFYFHLLCCLFRSLVEASNAHRSQIFRIYFEGLKTTLLWLLYAIYITFLYRRSLYVAVQKERLIPKLIWLCLWNSENRWGSKQTSTG